jgi:hypothetical protein
MGPGAHRGKAPEEAHARQGFHRPCGRNGLRLVCRPAAKPPRRQDERPEPGFQCELQRYIDDDACVIVLGNNYGGTASLLIDNLAAILFGEPYESFSPLDSAAVDASCASPYLGRYKGGQDFIRPGADLAVEWKDGHLLLNWGPGYVSALLPLTDEGFLDRLFGGRVTFIKNAAGDIDRLVWRLGRDYPAQKIND